MADYHKSDSIKKIYKQNIEKEQIIEQEKIQKKNHEEVESFEGAFTECLNYAFEKGFNATIRSQTNWNRYGSDYLHINMPVSIRHTQGKSDFIEKFKKKYPNATECMDIYASNDGFDQINIDMNCFIPAPSETKKRVLLVENQFRTNKWNCIKEKLHHRLL